MFHEMAICQLLFARSDLPELIFGELKNMIKNHKGNLQFRVADMSYARGLLMV